MQRLLCFDYDMTLLDHATWRVPESTLRAIAQLRPNWKIVMATGRDMRQPESRGGLSIIRPDALIHMNGAQVWADGQILYEFFWPRDLQCRLLKFAAARHICVNTILDGVYYTTDPDRLQYLIYNTPRDTAPSIRPASALHDQPVNALSMLGTPEQAALLEQAFPEVRVPLFAHKQGADIIPQALSKAQGMRHLLDHYRLTFQQVIFFGDSGNDLELIRDAGLGIAMGNAIPEVKAAADYVTDPIDQDGVWNALRHFQLLPE